MASLNTVSQPGAEEKECMVCWDNSEPLTSLPCTHQVCKSCLQAMGDKQSMACPLCRRTFARPNHEHSSIWFQRSRTAVQAANVILSLVTAIYHWRRGQYWSVLTDLALLVPSTAIPLAILVKQITAYGDEVWRHTASSSQVPIWGTPGFTFGSALFVLASKWSEIVQYD